MSNIDGLRANMLSLPANPAQTLTLCDTPPGGKKILFFEAYQENGDGFGDERISFDQNSAAMTRAWVNWDAVSDPDLARILRTSLVGGWYAPGNKKVTPLVHPYLPGLFVKDIVNVQSVACGPGSFHGITTSIPFQLALLTLSYASRPYFVNQPSRTEGGVPYNPNWVELHTKSANNHLTLPFGTVTFDTPVLGQYLPSAPGHYLTQGISYLTFIFHDIPGSLLYRGNDAKPVFADFLGQVNHSAIFGCAPGTLLADSADCEPFGDYYDESVNHYDVMLNCVYNSVGWNKQITHLGQYDLVHIGPGAAGANPVRPYLDCNFLTIFFNTINPL